MAYELGLENKTVVITGGSSGIGLATAMEFLRQGANVAICARGKERLEKAREQAKEEGLDLYTESVDVCDSGQLFAFGDHVCEKFGSLDVWLNNAGVSGVKSFLDISEEEWDSIIALNLTAVFRGSQYAARKMIEYGNGGVIMNAGSFQSQIPAAGSAPYGATKAGVVNLSRSLAGELAAYHIRVLSYVPGVIRTPMANDWMKDTNQLQNIPSERFGTPQDLANTLVYLASDKAEYINGVHVDVTGGKFCVQNPRYSFDEN